MRCALAKGKDGGKGGCEQGKAEAPIKARRWRAGKPTSAGGATCQAHDADAPQAPWGADRVAGPASMPKGTFSDPSIPPSALSPTRRHPHFDPLTHSLQRRRHHDDDGEKDDESR